MDTPNNLIARETNTSRPLQILLTVLFGALAIAIIYGLYLLWPTGALMSPKILHHTTDEQRYLLLVVLGGAFGATIQVIASFTVYIGNNAFVSSWLPWYCLRPVIGSGMALIFYLLLRAGLLTAAPAPATNGSSAPIDTQQIVQTVQDSAVRLINSNSAPSGDSTVVAHKIGNIIQSGISKSANTAQGKNNTTIPVNPFGMLAIACLAGLFSRQASDKLKEVFDTIFNLKQQPLYKDKLPTVGTTMNSSSQQERINSGDPTDISDVLPDPLDDNDDTLTPKG